MNTYKSRLLINVGVVLAGSLLLLCVGTIKHVMLGPWVFCEMGWLRLFPQSAGFYNWPGPIIGALATVAVLLLATKWKVASIMVDAWFLFNVGAALIFIGCVAD